MCMCVSRLMSLAPQGRDCRDSVAPTHVKTVLAPLSISQSMQTHTHTRNVLDQVGYRLYTDFRLTDESNIAIQNLSYMKKLHYKYFKWKMSQVWLIVLIFCVYCKNLKSTVMVILSSVCVTFKNNLYHSAVEFTNSDWSEFILMC